MNSAGHVQIARDGYLSDYNLRLLVEKSVYGGAGIRVSGTTIAKVEQALRATRNPPPIIVSPKASIWLLVNSSDTVKGNQCNYSGRCRDR